MKRKITIDQLKLYLNTGLLVKWYNPQENTTQTTKLTMVSTHRDRQLVSYAHPVRGLSMFQKVSIKEKPVVYRMSDLDKFIPELGFVPLKSLFGTEGCEDLIVIKPTESHDGKQNGFDVFSNSYHKIRSLDNRHIAWIPITGNIDLIPFRYIQKLIEWHFWIFGDEDFKQGLLVDKLKEQ